MGEQKLADDEITGHSLKGDYVNDLVTLKSSFFDDMLKLFFQPIMETLLLSKYGLKIAIHNGSYYLYFIQINILTSNKRLFAKNKIALWFFVH